MKTTDEIPNPLTDAGVQQEIRNKVEQLMGRPCNGSRDINAAISNRIKLAAEWAMFEGFRMGWSICKNRIKTLQS